MGYIRKRGKTWQVMVDAGRDPLTGIRVRLSGTAPTKEAAHELRERLERQAGRGDVAGAAATLDQLFTEFMATGGPPTLGAQVEYEGTFRRYVEKTPLAKMPVRKITPLDLNRLYATLHRERKLAPGTVRKVHTVLSSCLSYGIEIGWLHENPARRARPPAVGRTNVEATPVGDLRSALARLDGTLLGLFVRVTAVVGSRRGETLGLQWHDINFEAGQIMVRRRVSAHGRAVVDFTKNGTARTIAVPAAVLEALHDQHTAAEKAAAELGTRLPPWAFVFTSDVDGARPWSPDSTSRRARKAGLRLHSVRHHAATSMLIAGVDVRTAAERLGHSPEVLLKVYSHFVPAADQKAADLLGELLEEPEEGGSGVQEVGGGSERGADEEGHDGAELPTSG